MSYRIFKPCEWNSKGFPELRKSIEATDCLGRLKAAMLHNLVSFVFLASLLANSSASYARFGPQTRTTSVSY